ncbi:MAG: hypothetical protein ACI97K_002238 [Glaciecola sp.]|jgi:hypothetical protein
MTDSTIHDRHIKNAYRTGTNRKRLGNRDAPKAEGHKSSIPGDMIVPRQRS